MRRIGPKPLLAGVLLAALAAVGGAAIPAAGKTGQQIVPMASVLESTIASKSHQLASLKRDIDSAGCEFAAHDASIEACRQLEAQARSLETEIEELRSRAMSRANAASSCFAAETNPCRVPALRGPRPDAISPPMGKQRLLFVCLGNICRSPMAEGVFRRVAEDEGMLQLFHIDSAGLGDWHAGQAPDTRAQAAAQNRGIDISAQCARQITPTDFARFDLLLAMDGSNYQELIELAPSDMRHKIRRFLDFAPDAGTQDVPDPFFGGSEGFDHALDLIEQAARGLLAELLSDDSRPARRGAQSSSG